MNRGWLDERAYADLLALCQFLPGPASSQAGFAIGLMRAGYLGGLAAWAGFTLPSAIAMTLVAYGAGALRGAAGEGLLHGLKLVAVAIVAQAVLGMAQSLAPDKPRAAIAILALILMAFAPGGMSQIGGIVAGGLLGLAVCRQGAEAAGGGAAAPISRRTGFVFLAAYFALLALSFLPARERALAFLAAITRSGALVFGGGHVVLPLAAGRGRRARLCLPERVSGGLRRGAGRSRPALHVRRLPRRGRGACRAARSARRWRSSRSLRRGC